MIKRQDIKGESVDNKHKDEIDVLDYQWQMDQTGTTHTGTGGGAGKVSVKDLIIVKHVDKATPNLLKFCCSGKHIDQAVFIVRKAGENPLEYFKLTMKDVIITHVGTAGREENRLMERIKLNFAQYMAEYVPQQKDGSGGAAIEAGWDIAKNVAV